MKKGLTLIELLIVIGIIAVLAGIILITSILFKEKIRENICSNNLKSLYLALQMYRQDWDGIDPEKGQPLQCYEVGFIPYCNYLLSLKSYGVSRSNMFCPSDPNVRPIDLSSWLPITYTYLYVSSYQIGWYPSKREIGDIVINNPPFSTIIAKRGMELPVWICHWHALKRNEYPYRILLIRLNGQLMKTFKTYDMNNWEL